MLTSLSRITLGAKQVADERERQGLPPIPGGTSFLLEVPDGDDALLDYLTHNLGLELVAEFPEGFVLVANEDLNQTKLVELARNFMQARYGSTKAASILEIYDPLHSDLRVKKILEEELHESWPFADKKVFTFDVSVQTAGNFSEYEDNEPQKRKKETEGEFAARHHEWSAALHQLREKWARQQLERREEFLTFLQPYAPKLLERDAGEPAVLPDSFTLRMRMRGQGFNDAVRNYPHLFELTRAQSLRSTRTSRRVHAPANNLTVLPPLSDAPAVCVIDSGIMEGHRLLKAAMPGFASQDSRCFLVPTRPEDEVGDCVSNGGHGTRVAGAVLFPNGIPASGPVTAHCWLQNARVLMTDPQGGAVMPDTVRPAELLQDIVDFFHREGPRKTRIFNHSIGENYRCGLRRMSETAAMLDFLSYLHDVLFIQSAGNLERDGGHANNPSIDMHFANGHGYHSYLLEKSARIGSPAQSLHVLTVGSIALTTFQDADRKSVARAHWPSAFTRTGPGLWGSIKPDVVELGGDLVHDARGTLSIEATTSPELVCASPGPATGRDSVGTSFAAPKVAHLAAELQRQFPDDSVQLYRALIAQSARWPDWAEDEAPEEVLQMLGYGLPDLVRATTNTPYRVTLRTDGPQFLGARGAAIYAVDFPEAIRAVGPDYLLRLEVTLAYTAEPRRTRSSRRGYLATWLDWISSNDGETLADFTQRALYTSSAQVRAKGSPIPWKLALQPHHGEIQDTSRNRGTLQKDWAILHSHELPDFLAIAVRGHPGWADGDADARAAYSLVVSIEAINRDLEIYVPVETQHRVRNRVLSRRRMH